MVTVPSLLFLFLVMMTAACLLVLITINQNRRIRTWYLLVLATFIAWGVRLFQPAYGPQDGWLYLVPLAWLAGTFALGFPKTSPDPFSGAISETGQGEPRQTQEAIRGKAGTREALQFYFSLLFVVMIAVLTFYHLAASYR